MTAAAGIERGSGEQNLAQRKLGKNQREFLALLKSHRSVWHRGSAWNWKSAPSETLRMLEPLERRGYVETDGDRWRLTADGRRALRDAEAAGF